MFSDVTIQPKIGIWIWLYQHSTPEVKLRADYTSTSSSSKVKQTTECNIFTMGYVYIQKPCGELSQLTKISGQRESNLALIIWQSVWKPELFTQILILDWYKQSDCV